MGGTSFSAWKPVEKLHEGAEATAIAGFWMGRETVLKIRRARGYRHPNLDQMLTKQRLSAEVRSLVRLHSKAFPAPCLFDYDQKEAWVLISRIEGEPLYEKLKRDSLQLKTLEDLGRLIRKLHELGISHGDLTTHNVISGKDSELSLIDFGLSRQSPELEHLGLDLQVLSECLSASHSSMDDGMKSVLLGYLDNESSDGGTEYAKLVVERFQKISNRVRYHG